MLFARFVLVSLLLTLLPAVSQAAVDLERDQEDSRIKREEIRLQFMEQQEPVQQFEKMAVTTCSGGMAGVYPCLNIDLLAFMPLANIGGGSGNDIWGWTDPMTGREYAIMGRTSGTSFVDVTDPASPVFLGNLPPHGANSSWRDIKVYANHAYIVSEAAGHGMQIFDLTQLRSIPAPPVAFTETAHYDNFGSSHNLAMNEDSGFAYSIGTSTCSGGPHFIDLADPIVPVFAGCHVETIYTHDTQCVNYIGPDPDYAGREICVNSNETRINVIEVTDHSASKLVSQTFYSGSGYAHQGWLTEDHRYFLLGDELDEQNFGHNTRTRIFDMLDLDAPVLINAFDHATAAIDHNLYVHEGYAYMANYRAGLRIMDLADVGAGTLTEVAFFDIYPSSDSASFNGAWSVYPYFASGTVVVSGIEQGLFVLQPQLGPNFQLDVTPTQLDVCEPGVDTADIQLTARNGYVGNVSLSTTGLPAGAVEIFSVEPVAVPGSSMISVDVSGVAPGNYVFTIDATDGTLSRDKPVQLTVADQFPSQPAGLLPANGAVDVSRTPALEWSASIQAREYTVEISTDPGFGMLSYSATTSITTHLTNTSLDPTTTYFWRVGTTNPCGAGTYSATTSFTTLAVPPILLVDDDDNGPDVRAGYTAALLALGLDFDVWDTNNTDDEPSAAALAPYETVIWFTGDEFGGTAGPGSGGEQALGAWLDSSRCLLISSQDYYYDRGLTGLMTSYLGVSSVSSDVGQSTADGRGGVFTGLGPYTLSFPYTNYTDRVLAELAAESAFEGSTGISAVNKDAGVYRTAFLSFGLEALPAATDMEATLSAFLTWCDELPGLDGDSDGVSNGDDCLPGDSTVWTRPSAVSGLTITVAPTDNLSWSAPTVSGTSGTVTYDMLRSDGPAGFSSGLCLETDGTDTVATDAGVPLPGTAWYYLVRVKNSCGDNLGNGGTRNAVSCQ